MRKLMVLALLMTWAAVISANNPAEEAFNKGNVAYKEANFAVAYEAYSEAVTLDSTQATLWFNLGNAAFKIGRLAESILCFERSLKLNPQLEDAQKNLEIAGKQRIDKIKVSPSEKWNLGWQNMLTGIGATTFGIIALVALLLSLIGWFARAYINAKALQATLSVALLVVFGVSAFFGLKAHRIISNYPYAIVMEPKADVYTAPNGENISFVLHEGTRVEVNKVDGDWAEIALADGKVGWMKLAWMERV